MCWAPEVAPPHQEAACPSLWPRAPCPMPGRNQSKEPGQLQPQQAPSPPQSLLAALAEVSQPPEEPGRLSRILATVEQAKAEVAAKRAQQEEEQSSKEQASEAAWVGVGSGQGSQRAAVSCQSLGSAPLLHPELSQSPAGHPCPVPQTERHILVTAAGAVVSAAEDLKAILDRVREEIDAAAQQDAEQEAAGAEPQPWVSLGTGFRRMIQACRRLDWSLCQHPRIPGLPLARTIPAGPPWPRLFCCRCTAASSQPTTACGPLCCLCWAPCWRGRARAAGRCT